jgi:hypothetical protein
MKSSGIRLPTLTRVQHESARVRYTAALGKLVGIVVGCLLGMFPLVLFNKDTKRIENAP